MGTIRNGARGALDAVAKACKLSRTPGWSVGINGILGPDGAAEFLAVWTPFCAVVDTLIAADNYYNQKDFQDEPPTGDEDTAEI